MLLLAEGRRALPAPCAVFARGVFSAAIYPAGNTGSRHSERGGRSFFLSHSSRRPVTPGVGCSCGPPEQERNLSSVSRQIGCPILVHICLQFRSQLSLE